MEEKPPTQAGRDADRSRAPRAPFSTPEQPAPQRKPAERSPRRAGKAAPPVTFQPPEGDSAGAPGAESGSAETGSDDRRKPAARKGANPRQGRTVPARSPATPPATATPAPTGATPAATTTPQQAEAAATTPQPAQAAPAATATPEPTPATPAKATPARGATPKAAAGRRRTRPGASETQQAGSAETTSEPQATDAGATGGPVDTPPRAEGIEGAPEPSGSSAVPDDDRSQPVKAGRAKATPAKKAARKGPRPAPAKSQPATGSPTVGSPAAGTTSAESAPHATETEPAPHATETGPAPHATETESAPHATETEPAAAAGTLSTDAAAMTAGRATGEGTSGHQQEDDRTGAEPIPPADPQPSTGTPPAEETRTGAEPVPPADDQVEKTPDPTEAKAPAKPVPARSEPWAQLVADPGHAPELLALAAVQTIGPRATEWAARHREAYPGATPDALARLAVQQFTRFGSVSSVFAALAGSYAPITLLGSSALTYAEIVLHVAAAYGRDATDRERAVDLLVLAQVHPNREDAEAALATAEQPAYEEETRLTDAVWRLGRMVAAQAAAWAVLRGVNRFFPGTAMLTAIMTSRSGARNMGGKATAFYRAGRDA